MLNPHVFRAYDVRGLVGQDINPDVFRQVGRAYATLIRRQGGRRVAVGQDNRVSSSALKAGFVEGVRAAGVDVVDVGVVPTPILYFAAAHWKLDGGANITGSHNPIAYNGVKMVHRGAAPLTEEEIQLLRTLAERGDFEQGHGTLDARSPRDDYFATVGGMIRLGRRLTVVVDAGNGVAGLYAPELLRRIGCGVVELHCESDGRFPHHLPDPEDPANVVDLQARVVEVGADLDDSGLEVHDVRRVLRVGEVMGKAAVRLAVELDDPTPDAAQELRRVEPGDAVARVDDDRETTPEADHPADRGEVVVAGAPRVEGPVALLEVAALGERTEELDLLLRERRRAPVNHLHAVVRDRVVAPRDVGAAVELPVGGGEVEDRRRHDTDVHHVDAGGADALDEPRLQRLRRRAVVLPDGNPAPGPSPNQRAVRAADLTEHVGVDVPTDDAAHVVGAEHVRVEHCATLFATLL